MVRLSCFENGSRRSITAIVFDAVVLFLNLLKSVIRVVLSTVTDRADESVCFPITLSVSQCPNCLLLLTVFGLISMDTASGILLQRLTLRPFWRIRFLRLRVKYCSRCIPLLFNLLAYMYLLINYTGTLRATLDRYPPFNLYKRLIAAQFLETIGLLVENGIVFKSALKVMQYNASPYLSTHLLSMELLLSTGKNNIADVLATGLISTDDLMRLRVMAEVKGFEHGLIRMGIRGGESTIATLKLIARVIGGIFLAADGFLIMIVVQGVYMTGMAMGSA